METPFNVSKYGVGIDMGKDEFHVCLSAIDQTQRVKIKATRAFKNTLRGFAEFSKWVDHHAKEPGLPVHFLMEATGVYYEQLALFLHQRQAHVCVVLPQKTACYIKALGIKSKNDRIDAQALATMACQQRLDAWKPITEAMYKLRQLTRQHTELQELKTQLSNKLMAVELGMYQSAVVQKQQAQLIKAIDKQLAECVKLIQKAISENAEWKRKVEQIYAIKGVGVLTVAQIITETNEFALFENQRQLVSYAGYDVVESQSGKRVGKTRISKRGNSRIRRAMHMASLMVVRYEQRPFVSLYERVFERTKIKMKGYVAVQRKLLTLIYALWKKDALYEENFGSEGQKKVAPTKGATLHRPQVDVLEKANMVEMIDS
ncbi:MAG: IS110 family transposase [Cytophagales bacterium]|nr:MAG: IS110 family transposase [Cytophagales bacterium]